MVNYLFPEDLFPNDIYDAKIRQFELESEDDEYKYYQEWYESELELAHRLANKYPLNYLMLMRKIFVEDTSDLSDDDKNKILYSWAFMAYVIISDYRHFKYRDIDLFNVSLNMQYQMSQNLFVHFLKFVFKHRAWTMDLLYSALQTSDDKQMKQFVSIFAEVIKFVLGNTEPDMLSYDRAHMIPKEYKDYMESMENGYLVSSLQKQLEIRHDIDENNLIVY